VGIVGALVEGMAMVVGMESVELAVGMALVVGMLVEMAVEMVVEMVVGIAVGMAVGMAVGIAVGMAVVRIRLLVEVAMVFGLLRIRLDMASVLIPLNPF
jgi:hypothetical protein